MGGLEWDTYGTPDQNNAAVVGKIIGWNTSTLTADRNWTLPNDAQLGERCGIYITTGDDAYEVDILTDATGSEINGANHGVTSWSRLFISNECLILRCIKAGGAGDTDWIVEYDGRIPQAGRSNTTSTQSVSVSTETVMELDTNIEEVGCDVDTVNYRIYTKRDGRFVVTARATVGSLDSGKYYDVWVRINGSGTEIRAPRLFSGAGTTYMENIVSGTIKLDAGDYIQIIVTHNDDATEDMAATLRMVEIL
jgi:hypothetical protein